MENIFNYIGWDQPCLTGYFRFASNNGNVVEILDKILSINIPIDKKSHLIANLKEYRDINDIDIVKKLLNQQNSKSDEQIEKLKQENNELKQQIEQQKEKLQEYETMRSKVNMMKECLKSDNF